jgi:hypothetical protein
MKEERTIKELLQLMLEHQELFVSGLCQWTYALEYMYLITSDEKIILRYFINHNRPSKYSSIGAFKNRDRMFYWKSGNIKPRIKWIKKHIARL